MSQTKHFHVPASSSFSKAEGSGVHLTLKFAVGKRGLGTQASNSNFQCFILKYEWTKKVFQRLGEGSDRKEIIQNKGKVHMTAPLKEKTADKEYLKITFLSK